MPPAAVEFSPMKVAPTAPISTFVGDCGSADGSAVSQTSRPRFIKVRRHLRSGTTAGCQQSSACDSLPPVPTGSDQLKTGDSSEFHESNGNVPSSSVEPLEFRSSSGHATFSFNGAGRTSELKLNSSGNDAVSGKEAGSCFHFGSSQSYPASNFNSESNGFWDQFGKLNLGDNLKMKVETAAGSQEVKTSDAVVNFNFGGSMNYDNGLGSGAFVFTSNTRRSSVHDKCREGRISDEGKSKSVSLDKESAFPESQSDKFDVADRAKASDVNSPVIAEAAFSLRNGANVSRPCHGSLPAASVELVKNPHDAAENDSKTKMVDENMFVFGSKGNLSSQPAGISVFKPSNFMANFDPSFLFSNPMELDVSKRSSTTGRKKIGKMGKSMGPSQIDISMGKQNFPEELNTNENPGTSNCYSPMEFSPYQESEVGHQSSQEKQMSENMNSSCTPKMSFMMESTTGKVDVSGSSGDKTGKAASGSTHIGIVSGTQTAAYPPESDQFCSNSFADNNVQFRFSSSSKNSDQGSTDFAASGSQTISSLRSKHHIRSCRIKSTSASSSTTQGAAVENESSFLRGHSGHTSDREGFLKEAPRGEPMISRKSRPRLVKLRKHSRGTASTLEKAFIPNRFTAVPDGLFQVELNYADGSTSNNSAAQEVNCSVRDAGFAFSDSGVTSAWKSRAPDEECLSSKCGRHDNIASFSNAHYGGPQSLFQSYSGEFSSGVDRSDFANKKIFGYSSGIANFFDSEAMSMHETGDISEKMDNLNSSNCGNRITSVESSFVFGYSQGPMDQGSDNGVFIFKGSSKRSSVPSESSAAESYHCAKTNIENFGSTSHTSSSGDLGLDEGGKDESSLSSKLSDGTQKLNIHDVEHVVGNHRNKDPGNGESPFVFRSGTEPFDVNADNFPSSSSDQIRNPNTQLSDGLENGNNIRGVSNDHIMFWNRDRLCSDFAATSSSNPFIFQSGSTESNVINGGHQAVNPTGHAGDCLQSSHMAADRSDGNEGAFKCPESRCNLDSENICGGVANDSSSVKDSDSNFSKTEANPTPQFSFVLGVDKANHGGFVFSAPNLVGINSLRRKQLHKKRNCIQRTSASFVSHPDSNSSTTLPSEKSSGPRGDASHASEDDYKSYPNGQETCEQKEASTSASIQEACEKWRFRGNQAYKSGHFLRAERFYTKGIDSVPSHETSGCCLKPLLLCYSNRAATRMSVGRLREAIDDCSRAAALDPSFVKVQIREANCHLVLGEIEKAINSFSKCLESGANVCLDRRLIIEAADGLQRAQKVAEHIRLFTKLLEEKSSDAESRALEIISEAMSISKFSEKLLQMKAEALYMLQKYEEVIQLCEQSLVIADKNLVTSGLSKGLESVDDSKSEGKLRVRLWRFFLMAKSNFGLGRLEEALNLLQKVEMTGCVSDKCLSEPMASATLLSSAIRKLLDLKNSGNEAFRSKKYAEAVEHYTAALSSIGESRPFAAICFCNRAASHQALGQVADAIADCSLAMALDGKYAKAVSRRATLHELIRHFEQAAIDDCRLISILENESNQKIKSSGGPSDRANELRKAYKHKSSMEEESKRETPLDFYLILGVKKSDTAADIKKAYRKAALRHHPDKAGQFLRSDGGYEGQLWKEIAEAVHEDADRLFKIIGEAYAVLSDTSKRAQYDLEEEMRKTPNEGSGFSSYFRNSSDCHGFPSRRSNARQYGGQENWKTWGNSRSQW